MTLNSKTLEKIIKEANSEHPLDRTGIAIIFTLEASFESFKNDPTAQQSFGAFEELKGAAKLTLDVATFVRNQELHNEAQKVLNWIAEFEDQTEAGYEQQRQQAIAELGAYQKINRETHKLIKAFIGPELDDPRWKILIEKYIETFPNFKVSNSAWEKISPKSLSRTLCKILCDLMEGENPKRIPTLIELERHRTEAMLIFDTAMLRYLSRSLPGLDFSGALLDLTSAN